MGFYTEVLNYCIQWLMSNTSLGFSGSIFTVWFFQFFFILTILFSRVSNFSRIWSSAWGAYIYMSICGADLIGSEIFYKREWISFFCALFVALLTLSFPKARYNKFTITDSAPIEKEQIIK